MALLEVRDLVRRYGDFTVLDGLTLDVDPGEAVALVGPNGTGKSTALRCILGVDEPTEGTVTFDGEPLDERDPEVRAKIATVMDDLDFFPDLSLVEHLDLFAKAHRVPEAEQVVDQVLSDLGLIPQAGQLPSTLSSGQRQRLGLAAAFVRPRSLLILDEPEARLDSAGREWLAQRLASEKEAGLAILMASHSPELVDAVADRTVGLRKTSE